VRNCLGEFDDNDCSCPLEMLYATILEISEQLRSGTLSPVQLVRDCLEAIEQLNPELNAFITINEQSALAEARVAEGEILRGHWRGPLHGVPIGLKDLIDTAGIRTTAASELFEQREPSEDAEVARRLKAGGAIVIGKQNLHEFAYGGSSMVSYFGEVRNPRNVNHIAGGSSGGSAAAVAAGLCWAAIGTDTAGSIRLPASLCGVVGLKPTYGRVSAQGVIPLSVSLDHVGPIVRNVTDAAVMLQAIADDALSAAQSTGASDFVAALDQDTRHLCIGMPREFFFDDLDSEVSAAVEQAIPTLKSLTAEIKEIRIAVPTDRTLQSAESYRYHRDWVRESPQLYQPETLRRILSGQNISDADFERAGRELEKERQQIGPVFKNNGVDLLITPTTPIPAPAIAHLKRSPDQLRPTEIILLRNTRPVNVWGLPAITVPCGVTKSGLPIGLQIIGPPWREDLVLAMARAYEKEGAGQRE
jgi:aspartyl-tRNA(Asn)/glutamyl-tRNA(Gln) amidotransferase subunit A